MPDIEPSVFHSHLPLENKLERARMELLDLSARNRLLHVPRFSRTAKTVDVVDESAAEIFRLLVRDSRPFTFQAGRPDRASDAGAPGDTDALFDDPDADGESEEGDAELASVGPAAADDADANSDEPAQAEPRDARGVLLRHTDTQLQTRMTPSGLQKRLLDLYHDARTLEEEQGVNILFLALGALNWVDPNKKDNIRHAPLILVPVSLERGTAGEKFKLRLRPDDLIGNLSLQAYLERVHGLRLPEFEASDEFDPTAYFESVRAAISTQPDWSVSEEHIVLGLFSFAKFLMYRDLDPDNWPADSRLSEHAMIRSLLADGFAQGEPLLSEDVSIDPHIAPADMLHIVDSDSSQTMAVHDVRQGRDLVIQGPPGTGKSQTIANVIASAVADGKTVLFVAEKMAALEVVKRRLDQAGVGDICLELHSNKANKRALLDELRRTWELGSPRGDFPSALIEQLTDLRDQLNMHAQRMHVRHAQSGLTPYEIIGQLTRLRQAGHKPTEFALDAPTSWSADDVAQRRQLLAELTQRIDDIGVPASHPWHGVGLDVVLPTILDRLLQPLPDLNARLTALIDALAQASQQLEREAAPACFADLGALQDLAHTVAAAPRFSQQALASPLWEKSLPAMQELLRIGTQCAQAEQALRDALQPGALAVDVSGLEAQLAALPHDLPDAAYAHAQQLQAWLPQLQAEAQRLAAELGSSATIDTFAEMDRLTSTAERVAVAPDASPDAFTAAVWDHGIEQAGDLAGAVSELQQARAKIGGQLQPAAWSTDVRAARQALASHTGVMRHFNGEWRRAHALVRSIMTDAKRPVAEWVALLDVLATGQAAAAKIREGDAFGQSAFGADWRGEQSQSAPMLALVEWMRTLRGLGAEPRLIASRLEQRALAGARAQRVRQLLQQVLPALSALWSALGAQASTLLSQAPSPEHAALAAWAANAQRMNDSMARMQQVFQVLPSGTPARLARVRELMQWQKLASLVDRHDPHGKAAFGEAWAGQQSDWPLLQAGANWIAQNTSLRLLAARLPARESLAAEVSKLAKDAAALCAEMTALAQALKADAANLFATESIAQTPMSAVQERLAAWVAHPEQLSKWVTYRERADKARRAGLAQVVDRLVDARLQTSQAIAAFEMAYYEALLSERVAQEPELGQFDGQLHAQQVKAFADLDMQRIRAASVEVVRAHHRKIPPRDGGIGPIGVLRAEMARRKGHMPIRQLMQRSGPAVQALKPVMMMSPLSVAQFLTPGRLSFDLLVMDEASQIQPVDALGAIARCKQVVVVGDERQLPPTRFFAKLTGGEPSDDDDDGTPVADIESILGLFSARGLPQRMLRWHYRSRHQSLIALSNSQFYENKLFIVPSPYTREAGMGLRFHHVPDGCFDTGGTGTNVIEAQTVAQAIIAHAKTNPELSLGVATFSVSQRRAIQDELEILRRLNPDTEEFFHAHPGEPFFVKNLENVQGDERDVIVISVGYARNKQGYMAMRFGPLGADGGERRLNVLISRAKRRCEVYASITDEDIDLARAKGKGVFAFKLFLHFARTGRLSMAQPTARAMDSVFEVQVAAALQARGYQIHPQVGIAGFFIDLAVADPQRPGRYLLGIECDGASYHSSRSARDRDRLRQAVLEDHGWIIHRIWSTDWFQRPQEQLERTVQVIEAAKLQLDAQLETQAQARRAVPVDVVTIERQDLTEIGLGEVADTPPASSVYVEADLPRPGPYELHEAPLGVLADLVAQVVRIESPVHVDEVVTRLRTTWGLQRAGSRIEAAVQQAAERAQRMGRIQREGDFLSDPQTPLLLRDRSYTRSSGLRKVEYLPPTEIAAGIAAVVSANLGASPDEVITTISRQLGFKATSAPLRRAIEAVLQDMVQSGQVAQAHGLLVAKPPSDAALVEGAAVV